MVKTTVGIAAAALLLGVCQGCSVIEGETRHETKAIDLDKMDAARVELRMGAGELHVKSGTPKFLDADFAYNIPDSKPVVEYGMTPSGGSLVISQPKSSGRHLGRTVYTWDVNLNEQVPLDISAHLGAGEATLELGHLNLRSVGAEIGAGAVKVDLRGEPKRGYDVHVQGGVGELTVYLPKDAGISATAAGGLGDISATGLEKRDGVWINPERLNAPVTIHLDVKGGIGAIRLVR